MQTVNEHKFKKRFKEIFFDEIDKIEIGLVFNSDGNNLHYKHYLNKSSEYLVSYNQNTSDFWLSQIRICSKLESEFKFTYTKVIELSRSILKEHYKLP